MRVVVINPNSTATMTEAMTEAARVAQPGVTFEGWTSHDGPASIQGAQDGAAATPPLLRLMDTVTDDGADGVIIGCFDDTALAAAAQRVACPVVGIGQAAFHLSALRGWRFSVVTTLAVSVPVIEDNITQYGLTPWLGRVRASDVPVLALEDSPDAAYAPIMAEAEAALREDDVAAIVLGCAGMVHVTARLRAALPVPVIDPVEAAASCLPWLVRAV